MSSKTTMRPFAVVFGLFASFTLTCGLVWQEQLPRRPSDDRTEVQDEPLRKMTFTSARRRDNFTDMGLSPEDAERAAERAKSLLANEARFEKMLQEQGADVGIAFCPEPSELPVIYGAMRFLVVEEGGVRSVIDGNNGLLRFVEQPWYTTNATVRPIYDAFEARKDRRVDATVMGIAAILTQREQEAVNYQGPWSTAAFVGGDFETVVRQAPAVRAKTVEYLALVQVLSEIANRPDGICDTDLL